MSFGDQMLGVSNYDNIMSILGNSTLFYIERSLDREIVAYEAVRKGSILSHPFVDVYWTNSERLGKRESVGDRAKELFFGIEVKKTENKYKMFIASLPTKIITLHLKKSGAVVAKTVIDGKEAKVIKIFVNMDSTALGLPMVTSLTVYGEHKKRIVQEEIEITDDIRNKFDVSSFLPNLGDFAKIF
jgi:hypothetical protein